MHVLHVIKRWPPSICACGIDSQDNTPCGWRDDPVDNDNIKPVLLPAEPTIHNMLYGTATRRQRTASISAAINRRDRIVLQKGKKTSMQNNTLTVTRCRRAGVGSTTFTLAQMTVAMLLWSSVMTWIYSCFWSTEHCTVIYRVISPSRWRSGTVLSFK